MQWSFHHVDGLRRIFCVESGLVQDLRAVRIQAGQENTDLLPAPQSNCHILLNGHDRRQRVSGAVQIQEQGDKLTINISRPKLMPADEKFLFSRAKAATAPANSWYGIGTSSGARKRRVTPCERLFRLNLKSVRVWALAVEVVVAERSCH